MQTQYRKVRLVGYGDISCPRNTFLTSEPFSYPDRFLKPFGGGTFWRMGAENIGLTHSEFLKDVTTKALNAIVFFSDIYDVRKVTICRSDGHEPLAWLFPPEHVNTSSFRRGAIFLADAQNAWTFGFPLPIPAEV